MGDRGPVPKREDQRLRRNKDEVETETITVIGQVPIPALDFENLGIENPHPLVLDLYRSLAESAQSRFYEPSDWQTARLTMLLINDMISVRRDKDGQPYPISAVKIQAVHQMMNTLLMTEGDRRRVRLEVERKPSGPDAKVTSIEDLYRKRLGLLPAAQN